MIITILFPWYLRMNSSRTVPSVGWMIYRRSAAFDIDRNLHFDGCCDLSISNYICIWGEIFYFSYLCFFFRLLSAWAYLQCILLCTASVLRRSYGLYACIFPSVLVVYTSMKLIHLVAIFYCVVPEFEVVLAFSYYFQKTLNISTTHDGGLCDKKRKGRCNRWIYS